MSEKIPVLMFVVLAFLTGASALSLLWIRNVLHATLLLIVALLGIAGIYVLAMAEFIAVAQILVYAGGVMALIVFGIMLTSKGLGKPLMASYRKPWLGLAVGVVFFILLNQMLLRFPQEGHLPSAAPSIPGMGMGLMTGYVLPFELTGVLLLVALIGVAVAVRSIQSDKP